MRAKHADTDPAAPRPRAPRTDRQALERELAAILRQHGIPTELASAAGPDRDPATVVALARAVVVR